MIGFTLAPATEPPVRSVVVIDIKPAAPKPSAPGDSCCYDLQSCMLQSRRVSRLPASELLAEFSDSLDLAVNSRIQQLAEAVFNDRALAFLDRADFFQADIDADHAEAEVRQACHRDGANITKTDHADRRLRRPHVARNHARHADVIAGDWTQHIHVIRRSRTRPSRGPFWSHLMAGRSLGSGGFLSKPASHLRRALRGRPLACHDETLPKTRGDRIKKRDKIVSNSR